MELSYNFLNKLKSNNNRDWFNDNKELYNNAKLEVEAFGKVLHEKMSEHDNLEGDSAKFFRIYRDVRFSKNKLPYKTHWGGYFSRVGDLRGGYYFHIEPKNSFIACGFWNPNKEDLLHIRKQIKLDGQQLKNALKNKGLAEIFSELKGEAVKTQPQGFSKEDENLDLIRYKQFLLEKKISDEQILSPNIAKTVSFSLEKARPFLDIMTCFLNTDLDGYKKK